MGSQNLRHKPSEFLNVSKMVWSLVCWNHVTWQIWSKLRTTDSKQNMYKCFEASWSSIWKITTKCQVSQDFPFKLQIAHPTNNLESELMVLIKLPKWLEFHTELQTVPTTSSGRTLFCGLFVDSCAARLRSWAGLFNAAAHRWHVTQHTLTALRAATGQ